MQMMYINLLGFPEIFPVYSIQADGQLVLISESTYETLGEIVPDLYKEYDMGKILIEGAAAYAEELKSIILENNSSKYANQKMNIEVI